jgi:hypothetical protein
MKMKFAIVRPAERRVEVAAFESFDAACKFAGIDGKDFGTIWMPHSQYDRAGLSIVVYEFGLLKENPTTKEPIVQQPMFAINRRLYAGNAVLFSFNESGETISLSLPEQEITNSIIWLKNREEAEMAIMIGLVERPVFSIDGNVISSWPNMVIEFDKIRGLF